MADARKLAERHPGLKAAVKESIKPSVHVLEERAKQGSLKGNYFETFEAASDEEIKQFLAVIETVDHEFDVDKYLDKKKPFHYTPTLKAFIDEHVIFTHYAITFQRYKKMSIEYLQEAYPEGSWTLPLEPLPCPVVSSENSEKFVSYEDVKQMAVKDYDDKFRPGKHLKVPANIPFSKNKQRASYGSQVEIVCDSCGKRRAVYFEHKAFKVEIEAAKAALRNTKYVCGGRISSFGRSLAIMEELSDNQNKCMIIDDEIENLEVAKDIESSEAAEDQSDESEVDEPAQKKSKRFVIDSDSDEPDQAVIADEVFPFPVYDGVNFMSCNQTETGGSLEENNDLKGPCHFCGKFETGHKCKVCLKRCCNICNTETDVEEQFDNVCPGCHEEKKTVGEEEVTDTEDRVEDLLVRRGRGRPSKAVEAGQILIPLHKKGRGRPKKVTNVQSLPEKRARGRPRNQVKKVAESPDDLDPQVKLVSLMLMITKSSLKEY